MVMPHSSDELMQLHTMLATLQQENRRLTKDKKSLTVDKGSLCVEKVLLTAEKASLKTQNSVGSKVIRF
jgi:hypothetical protein